VYAWSGGGNDAWLGMEDAAEVSPEAALGAGGMYILHL
jgi:hypothetical protein